MSGEIEQTSADSPGAGSLGRRLWTGSILVSGATIAARAGGLLGNVVVIRLLDLERVGQLGVIDSWLGATALFALLGVGTAVTRHIAEALHTRPDEAGEFSTAAFLLGSVLGLVVGMAVFVGLTTLLVDSIDPTVRTLRSYAAPVAGLLFLTTLKQIVTGITYSLQAYRSLLVASVIVGVLSVPLSWVFVLWYGLGGALALRVLMLIVETAVLGWAAARELRVRKAYLSTRRLGARTRQLLQLGLPVSIGELIVNPVPPLMLSLLAQQPGGLAQVGVLTAIGRLASISGFVPASLAPIIIPLLSTEWGRGDHARFAAGTLLSIRAFWFVTLPIVAFFIAGSPSLLALLFGTDYAAAWPIAAVVLITTFVASLNQTVDRAFVSAGRVWLSTSNNIVLVILFVLLGFWFIPRGLAMGYAASFLIAYSVYVVWQYQWLWRLWSIRVQSLWFEGIVSVAVLGVAVLTAAGSVGFVQLPIALGITVLVAAIEFKYFLRPNERRSLVRYSFALAHKSSTVPLTSI